MNKRIFQALFVAMGLALASASVFASKGECDHGWSAGYEKGRVARYEKHMAKLHDSLKLTSAQESAWTEFANKVKPVNMGNPGMAKPDHKGWEGLSAPDRLDKVLDNMKVREKELADHAAAVRTFYGSLTTDQKKIFDHRFQEYLHRHEHRPHDNNDAA